MLWEVILFTNAITSRRSSGVEHFLGREGVVSSILTDGSKKKLNRRRSSWVEHPDSNRACREFPACLIQSDSDSH